MADPVYEHGEEDEHIMKHDRQVVDVAIAIEKDTVPKIVENESVMLKVAIVYGLCFYMAIKKLSV